MVGDGTCCSHLFELSVEIRESRMQRTVSQGKAEVMRTLRSPFLGNILFVSEVDIFFCGGVACAALFAEAEELVEFEVQQVSCSL